MRTYPALDLRWSSPPDEETVGRVLAGVDDFAPQAVEEHPDGIRVFFADTVMRDAARTAVIAHDPNLAVTSLLVDDEDWAERSQAALGPVRVGRCVVTPPWTADRVRAEARDGDDTIVMVIQPSMGFGTGHHASTRLCLGLLQAHVRAGARVLDVGTGSGVLAIAASALGASQVVGIDHDPDALVSATENVSLNDAAVSLDIVDITDAAAAAGLVEANGPFDLVIANITGAMLQRIAPGLRQALAPEGVVVVSGFQTFEADEVGAALAATGMDVVDRADEDSWVALAGRRCH